MSMKLGNFLDPETKGEDNVHQHYRFDSEVARKMDEFEHKKELEGSEGETKKKSLWERLLFWR